MAGSRVRVVAAVIEQDGRYLITQRLPKAVFPLYWEFPGGKVEPGEDDATALKREMLEETGVTVEVGELLEHRVHEYDTFGVDFNAYRARIVHGELRAIHVADFRWVSLAEMSEYSFPPADEKAIALLAGSVDETP